MAFSGLNITARYAVPPSMPWFRLAIRGRAVWSENLTTPNTTSNVAPAAKDNEGSPVFSIRSAVDSWISIGKAPDATNGVRDFVPANVDYDISVSPGDKLAWIAA